MRAKSSLLSMSILAAGFGVGVQTSTWMLKVEGRVAAASLAPHAMNPSINVASDI